MPDRRARCAQPWRRYTPNVPWLQIGCPNVVDMDGAGTSSATPQVAAAAALWLARHGGSVPGAGLATGGGGTCGAVRQRRPTGQQRCEPDPLLGRGVLRANRALEQVPVASDLQAADRASARFAFLHLLSSVFGVTAAVDARQQEMFELEMTQLALNTRAAREAVPDPDAPPERIDDRQRRRFLDAILAERTISGALRQHIEGLLGRGGIGAPSTRVETEDWPSGAELPWRLARPPPTRRRLRVFATDPADSGRLATAPVNMATIEVPWETLQAGPVGEYLEVVDVDPASDAGLRAGRPQRPAPAGAGRAGAVRGQSAVPPADGLRGGDEDDPQLRAGAGPAGAVGRRRLAAKDGRFQPAPDGGVSSSGCASIRTRCASRTPITAREPQGAAVRLFRRRWRRPRAGGGLVFTCLSHDIVAHETTHALLDGLHRRYQEATNPDVLAFHEAFADIVALFQHFTMPELLRRRDRPAAREFVAAIHAVGSGAAVRTVAAQSACVAAGDRPVSGSRARDGTRETAEELCGGQRAA